MKKPDDTDRMERVARAIYDALQYEDWVDGFQTDDDGTRTRIEGTFNLIAAACAALAAATCNDGLQVPAAADQWLPIESAEADRIANLADIALQDALTQRDHLPGVDVYDGETFLRSLAGNGYRIVPLPAPPEAK